MNPKKLEGLEITISKHRTIVPVYIPNTEGYYKDAFDLLKLCLTTLFQTISKNSVVTVINNNCNEEVSEYLYDLFKAGKIEQLILNTTNKGKIEAVLDAFRNSKENLITITDADVLFKQDWLLETKKVFNTFPRVGFVSPLPLPDGCNYYSKWSWFYGFLNGKIVREEHADIESLNLFKKSILIEKELSDIEKTPFKLKKNGITAVIGAGHFCATYNKNIISEIPYEFSGNKFGVGEALFFDKPIEDAGFLRLATDKGWVFHMGANTEEWMLDVVNENVKKEVKDIKVEISNKGYSPNFIFSLLMKARFKKIRYKLVKKV